MKTDLLATSTATALAGLATGALAFVSFVDVRSFLQHVDKKKHNTDVVRAHFQVWWPCGRDFMAPLIGCNVLSHLTAWYLTGQSTWIWSGALIGSIGPYTAMVLGEDIDKLRHSSTAEVASTTRRFCNLHHVRLGMSATAFAMAILALGTPSGE
jgi:hypothetical protein